MVPNNRPNDYIISGPCNCPSCQSIDRLAERLEQVNRILAEQERDRNPNLNSPRSRLARVINDNLETEWTEIEHPKPGMFRTWGTFALWFGNALFWATVVVAVILASWAILSR